MLLFALLLGFFGLLLSATFSGSETAFYRIPKVRLKLDAIENDPTAIKLLWFVNHPGQFVATILVGNNVANYAVSMATVLLVGILLPKSQGIFVEIASTLILAPFLFVYGEMFPKYLTLNAPNRFLRRLSPFIAFFYRLFLPITMVLYFVNSGIARLLGQSQELLQLTLGRQELAAVLDEGKETGILVDAQRRLADGVFEISHEFVQNWMTSRMSCPLITTDMKPRSVLEIARKHDLVEMPVFEKIILDMPETDSRFQHEIGDIPVGSVRVIDLELAIRNRLDDQARQLLQLMQTELPIRSTVEIASRHSVLTAMILLQTLHSSFGCVIDEHRRCIGYVCSDQLRDILFGTKEKTAMQNKTAAEKIVHKTGKKCN